ncbi:hypothetical protein CALVIDRAFT_231512 [Calocera viscosa TUFC12733]|uniref:Uncharacterized protein n=1 Tax=Calocera viscosa (strain TUFC12733) TaxID=1330018 RepID=A0A167JXU9_CALVF|nr:hypothetical protein CALVIDRAFT_231512 [Calocera viscosa TUFC12733]
MFRIPSLCIWLICDRPRRLTDDILVSKSWDEIENREGSIVIWQWTELGRFFPAAERGMGRQELYWERNAQPFTVRTWDVDNCRLYREVVRFKETPQVQYTRLGVHHAFPPPGTARSPDTVENLLLAWGGTSRDGALMLVNPLLQPKPQQPGAPEDAPPVIKTEEDVDGAEVAALLLSAAPAEKVEKKRADVGWVLADDMFGEVARQVPGLRERVRAEGETFPGELGDKDEGPGVTLNVVAVKPRGARWIVGAGEWGVILVWRMKA